MNTVLTVDLTQKTAREGGSDWLPPAAAFGDDLIVGLNFTATVAQVTTPVTATLTGFQAAIGREDARPESGTWRLQIGDGESTEANTTAELCMLPAPAVVLNGPPATQNIRQMTAALNGAIAALGDVVAAYGAGSVVWADGSWELRFGAQDAQVPLKVVHNRLWPLSGAIIRPYQVDGLWVHEIRLTQMPVAFTDAVENVLPDPPRLTKLQEGGSADGSTWNTIYELYMPSNFAASYCYTKGLKRSVSLSVTDGAAEIQTALAMFGDGITVGNILNSRARIELGGDFAGADQSWLDLEVVESSAGPATFSMPLDWTALAVALRKDASVTMPLVVKATVTQAGSTTPARRQELFRVDFTITRSPLFDEMRTVAGANFEEPWGRTEYLPFDRRAVIPGALSAERQFGNGIDTTISINHGLNAWSISSVVVREDKADGRILANAGLGNVGDYRVTVKDANVIDITMINGVAPALNALVAVITTAGPVRYLLDHHHSIGEIDGLGEALSDLETRIDAVAGNPYLPAGTVKDAAAKITISLGTPEEWI